MKKKILSLILFAAVLCGVIGCKPKTSAMLGGKSDKINVITTNFAPFDFVRNIGQDKVNVTMLLPPGAESHSFEPSPADVINIQNCDIFIYVGGESDNWIERILQSAKSPNQKTLVLMEIVDVVEEEIVEGMQDEEDEHDHDHDHEGFFARLFSKIFGHFKHDTEIEYDEHVWTSPQNAILISRAIMELLCEIDPANDGFYRQNAASFIAELEKLDADFIEVVNGAKRNTIVFGDRFPFRYFADAYGLQYFAAFPGCSTDTEPSAQTVAFLINKIRSEQIPVVFHAELSNERMADTISAETGAKKLLLHACHNVSKQDMDAGLGYLDFMRQNVENLRYALY